jgi:hypothetical protein
MSRRPLRFQTRRSAAALAGKALYVAFAASHCGLTRLLSARPGHPGFKFSLSAATAASSCLPP